MTRRDRRLGFAVLAASALLCIGAAASDPAERLKNPAEEARARALFREIRCLVCQNQSIDESDADLAADLRRIVRDQIAQGRSNADIERFLVDRYGQFVLLRPAFSPGNAILWLAPFAIVAVGGAAFALRRAPLAFEPPLDPVEASRVAALSTPVTVPPKERPNADAQARQE